MIKTRIRPDPRGESGRPKKVPRLKYHASAPLSNEINVKMRAPASCVLRSCAGCCIMSPFEEAPLSSRTASRRGNGTERVSSRRLLRKRKLAFCFREEEGWSGYAVFAALSQTAETEWSGFLLTTSGCSAVGSAGGLGPSGRGFKSLHSDHFRIGVDTFVSTPIFCIIDLLLPRKMMLYDRHFQFQRKSYAR